MTLTQKERKEFTIISPKWAEMFETYKFDTLINNTFCKDNLCKSGDDKSDMDSDLLNLNNSTCCVLGEAYGFKGSMYGDCDICYNYSLDFNNACNESEFERYIVEFVKHFKTQHKKLYNDKVKTKL